MSGPDQPPAEATPPTPSGPAGAQVVPRRKRGRETARDMILSLAVVGLFVGFLVAVTYRPRPDPVRAVDPAPAIAQARDSAPFEPVVPVGLPATWRPTSAGYESARTSSVPNAEHWHVGYVTPEQQYAAVDQATGEATVMVRSVIEGADLVGTGEGAFAGWQHWETADGRRQAYVLPGSTSTVMVHGTAGDSELSQLEASLQPQPGS